MVTRTPGIALGVLSADCAPVLLAEPKAGVVGVAHAGWTGALSGVIAGAWLLGASYNKLGAIVKSPVAAVETQ